MFLAEKLADAAMQISVMYELVFGKGFISRHLKVLVSMQTLIRARYLGNSHCCSEPCATLAV